MSLLENICGGSFAEPRFFEIGFGAKSLAAADLNGDGRLDLASANYSSNDVSVLLNTGALTFEGALFYPADGTVGAVAAADLDGDEDMELAAGSVSVLPGNGDGTFDAPARVSSGGGVIHLMTGDL